MEIRRTTTADAEFGKLVRALDAELRGIYGAVQDTYAPHNHVETIATAVVARDGDTPIGCGCFRPFDAATVELKRMFVDPARRGRGVASAVIGELETWARELGFAVAILETGNLQHAALELYQRRGYAITAPFGPYVGMPASVCMHKRL